MKIIGMLVGSLRALGSVSEWLASHGFKGGRIVGEKGKEALQIPLTGNCEWSVPPKGLAGRIKGTGVALVPMLVVNGHNERGCSFVVHHNGRPLMPGFAAPAPRFILVAANRVTAKVTEYAIEAVEGKWHVVAEAIWQGEPCLAPDVYKNDVAVAARLWFSTPEGVKDAERARKEAALAAALVVALEAGLRVRATPFVRRCQQRHLIFPIKAVGVNRTRPVRVQYAVAV